jgi:Right handed beta helix region
MQSNRTFLRILGISLIVLTAALFAQAQATRTWVSGVGDDVNPCSRTAPCKTFAGAISKTATNGEINCLDPAGYGAVTVTKSITIDCEDTQGSILSAGTNGVIVNITAATDTKKAFMLRGISINGAGTGINGIRVLAASQVTLDEVVIQGVTQHGLSLETTTGSTKVNVGNSLIRNNAGNGINSFILGGSVTLAIFDTKIYANTGTGVNLSNGTKGSVSGSNITGNGTGVATFNAELGVSSCDISHNTTGVSASTGSTIRITGNIITNNGTGLSTSGGTIVSFTSNMFQGNTVNGTPTSTVLLQ